VRKAFYLPMHSRFGIGAQGGKPLLNAVCDSAPRPSLLRTPASELIGVRVDDLKLQPQPSVLVHGKGRRERCLPLWKTTTSALRAWLAAKGTVPVPELFVSARGESLTRSGFEYILRKHVRTTKQHCPWLTTKRVHPHVLRHTCALTFLQATKDLRKVALWLGHAKTQTTEMYTPVDPAAKLEPLESVVPPKLRSWRFKASDKLIAWLEAATFMSTKKQSKSTGRACWRQAPRNRTRRIRAKYEEFRPQTIWSLSNAFTSAFKELDPIPQFKATAKLGEFLESRFSQSF